MPVGGKREGAGRKKGSLAKKTQEIIAAATANGITPLEVMLEAMRYAYDLACGATNIGQKMNLMVQAAELAKDAAPFVHPRLQAIAHTGAMGGPIQTQDVPLTREQVIEQAIARGIPVRIFDE